MEKQKNIFNRKIVNDPKLQFGVSGFFMILALFNLSFFIVLFKLLESRLLQEIDLLNEENKKYFLVVFNDLASMVFKSTLIFGGFTVLFSLVGGVLLLQHVSGPSSVIKNFLTDIKNDNSPRYPLKFRKHDFFNEHAQLLNEIYEKYKKKDKNK